MHNTPHNRESDVDQEFQHTRASDAVLLELLTSVKVIGSKQDTLAVSVSEIRKSNEHIRDRLTRVEGGQEELSSQVKATRSYVENHAQEEEKILHEHVKKMGEFQDNIEHIQRGFPKNEDGERDPRSHADDHETEMAKKKEVNSLMKDIRKWMVVSLLASLGTGVLYLLATGTRVELSRVVQEQPTTNQAGK